MFHLIELKFDFMQEGVTPVGCWCMHREGLSFGLQRVIDLTSSIDITPHPDSFGDLGVKLWLKPHGQ